MSILTKQKDLLLISHEKYINNIYHNVNGVRYCFNKDLFDISEPFKSYEDKTKSQNKTKKRKLQESPSIATEDISFPEKFYNLNKEIIKQTLFNENESHKLSDDKQSFLLLKQQSENFEVKLLNLNSEAKTCEYKRKYEDTSGDNYKETQKAQANAKVTNVKVLNTVTNLQKVSTIDFGNFNGGNLFVHPIIKPFKGANFLFPHKSTFINSDVLKCTLTEKYDVIVIDPPWKNKAIHRKNKKRITTNCSSTSGYSFMSNEDIEKIPIDKWLKQNGIIFVWCTNAQAHHNAIDKFFITWNVKKVALWYWLKVTTQGEPIIPFTEQNENNTKKQPYEVLIIGVHNNKTKWPLDLKQKLLVSVPSGMHSHKPPLTEVIHTCFSDLFNFTSDNVKCLEVFARTLQPGWTSVGNEVLKLQNVCFYEQQT